MCSVSSLSVSLNVHIDTILKFDTNVDVDG